MSNTDHYTACGHALCRGYVECRHPQQHEEDAAFARLAQHAADLALARWAPDDPPPTTHTQGMNLDVHRGPVTRTGQPMVDVDLDELMADYEASLVPAEDPVEDSTEDDTTATGGVQTLADIIRRGVKQGLIQPQKKYA